MPAKKAVHRRKKNSRSVRSQSHSFFRTIRKCSFRVMDDIRFD